MKYRLKFLLQIALTLAVIFSSKSIYATIIGSTIDISLETSSGTVFALNDVDVSTPQTLLATGTSTSGIEYSLYGFNLIAGSTLVPDGTPFFALTFSGLGLDFSTTALDTGVTLHLSGFDENLISTAIVGGGGPGFNFSAFPIVSTPVFSIVNQNELIMTYDSIQLPGGWSGSNSVAIQSEMSTVPEPTALSLLGLGLLGFLVSRRIKNNTI